MKKLLCLIAGVIFLLPITAKAAQPTWECGNTSVRPGETITCTLYGTNANLTQFNARITVKGDTSIVSVTAADGWTAGSLDPNNISLTRAVAATGKYAILTVTYRISPNYQTGDPCGISLVELSSPVNPTPDPTPIDPTPVPETPNPDTGANFIPYIIIGAGSVVALSAYYLATKKNKFYKI